MTKEERDKLLLFELAPEFKWTKWKAMPNWCKFGLLWDRAKEREWWDEFCKASPHKAWIIPIGLIHPDRFADALAEFLTQRKEK